MWLYVLIFLIFFFWGFFMMIVGVVFLILDRVVVVYWLMSGMMGLSLSLSFIFDWMSLIFGGVVALISGCVFFYSVEYMDGDKDYGRFVLIFFMFVVFMMVLIFSSSLIGMLMGWDGLGLVSYCLVVYYQSYSSFNAGMLTGIMNRLGDSCLIVGIGLMFIVGDWDYSVIGGGLIFGFMVILASMTKSAQIPFSSWLPAAMAAPTPVSALVHSSTLVTAGVYLAIRLYESFMVFEIICLGLVYLGVLTMFMAGVSAAFECDMSSVIAFSTLSQLGMMMVSVGVGNVVLAYFHLVIHAVFKALMFLVGGKFIHDFGGSQDVRIMGGLVVGAEFSFLSLMISNFSLCGLPFVSGFYSSDLILEMGGYYNLNYVFVIMMFLGVIFTFIYSIRLGWLSGVSLFSGVSLGWSDASLNYVFPMFFLGFFGIVLGSMMFWVGIPESGEELVFSLWKVWPVYLVGFGVLVGLIVMFSGQLENVFGVGDFVYSMWFMAYLSSEFVYPALSFGSGIENFVDYGWLEGSLVGVWDGLMSSWSLGLSLFMSLVYFMSLVMMVGLFLIMLIYL